MSAEVLTILKKLIEDIREDGATDGYVKLRQAPISEHGIGLVHNLTVGLARFQSYRGRTEAALLEELEDFVHDKHILQYHVIAEDMVVKLRTW